MYFFLKFSKAFFAVDLNSEIEEFFFGVITKGKGLTLITWSGVAVPFEEYALTFLPLMKYFKFLFSL